MSYFIKNKTKKATKGASSRVSSSISVAGGGISRAYRASKPASKYYHNTVNVDSQDTGVTIFEHKPVAGTASDGMSGELYDFKEMIVHNKSPQVAELMIQVQDWAHSATNDAADGTQTELRMLLGPKQTLVLPTSHIIQYSAANSAANTYIRHFWDDGTVDEDGDHEYPGQKDPLNGKNNADTLNGATIDTHNSTATAKTDERGNYNYTRLSSTADLTASNFFGQAVDGFVPGSFVARLCEFPYQSINVSKNFNRKVLLSDDTGLTKGATYYLKVNVDGAGVVEIDWTMDSKNVNFGGPKGLIAKINDALNTKYKTAGNNLFGKKVVCKLIDGDLRFTSFYSAKHHNNGGTQSSVALTAGTTGTNFISGSAGRIPNDLTTVKPRFSPWEQIDKHIWDDGFGNLRRQSGGVGTINYSTGMVQLTGLPPNTEMAITAISDSALGGESTTLGAGQGTSLANTLVHVKARSTNLYRNSIIEIFVAGN